MSQSQALPSHRRLHASEQHRESFGLQSTRVFRARLLCIFQLGQDRQIWQVGRCSLSFELVCVLRWLAMGCSRRARHFIEADKLAHRIQREA